MPVIEAPIDPNVTPSENGGYTLIPEGKYHLKCLETAVKAPKQAGKHPQLELKLQIVAAENDKRVGSELRMWLSLSPNSTPYFLKPYLQAVGCPFEEITVDGPTGPGVSLRFDSDVLIGSVVLATNKHGEYNGKPQERWSNFEASEFDPNNIGSNTSAEAPAPAAGSVPDRAPRRGA